MYQARVAADPLLAVLLCHGTPELVYPVLE